MLLLLIPLPASYVYKIFDLQPCFPSIPTIRVPQGGSRLRLRVEEQTMYARVSTLHAMLLIKILLADLSQVLYAALVWNATYAQRKVLPILYLRVSGSTCHLSGL